jgi:hypothetical protein
MRASDIVKALSNVERTYPDGIVGKTVVLNAFRW